MYKNKTLRKMPPETRKLARLINELESVRNRCKNLLPKIQDAEFQARALWVRRQAFPVDNQAESFTPSDE